MRTALHELLQPEPPWWLIGALFMAGFAWFIRLWQ